ncbi:MAG: hypothetical protein PHY31_04520 [Smithellaceae bacterium]|nr:hypothetical protein [Smithellaceae bacterium]
MTFKEVGDLNLAQFKEIEKAIMERLRISSMGIFGGASPAVPPARRKPFSGRVELTPDQFDRIVEDKKRALQRDRLSLTEVF